MNEKEKEQREEIEKDNPFKRIQDLLEMNSTKHEI